MRRADHIEIYDRIAVRERLTQVNSVLVHLTKWYLHGVGATFVELRRVQLPSGKSREVVVFSDDKKFMLGQVTIFGTTILHEIAFRSHRLLTYVLTHEDAHTRQWYGWPLFVLMPSCFLLAFLVLLLAFMEFVIGIATLNPSMLGAAGVFSLFVLILVAIPCLYSWFLEFDADRQAARLLGVQHLRDAITDVQTPPRVGFFTRFMTRLTHPPRSWSLRICEVLYERRRQPL